MTTDAPRPTARFVKWLDDTTVRTVADHLGVSIFTVYGWRRFALKKKGGNRPDPRHLGAILKLAAGRLTAADIYPSA